MFVIGANLQPNEALETLKDKYGEFDFPKTLRVENLMPMDIVDPWIGLSLDGNIKQKGVSKGEFNFPTFGHLMKFEADMEALAKISGYARAVVISDLEPISESHSESNENEGDEGDKSDTDEQHKENTDSDMPLVDENNKSHSSETPKRRGRPALHKEGGEE